MSLISTRFMFGFCERTRDQIWLTYEVSGRAMTYAVDDQFAVGSKDLAEAVMTVDGCPREVEGTLGSILVLDHADSIVTVSVRRELWVLSVKAGRPNRGHLLLRILEVGWVFNVQ